MKWTCGNCESLNWNERTECTYCGLLRTTTTGRPNFVTSDSSTLISRSETHRITTNLNLDLEFMMRDAHRDLADVQLRIDRGVAKLEAKLRVVEEALLTASETCGHAVTCKGRALQDCNANCETIIILRAALAELRK